MGAEETLEMTACKYASGGPLKWRWRGGRIKSSERCVIMDQFAAIKPPYGWSLWNGEISAPQGQPWWQWRSVGVWASGRGLGGLWGHVLGPCLPDTTVPWCLHQSLCLQLLDTQGDWTWWQKREKAMKGEWHSWPLNQKQWLSRLTGLVRRRLI